MKCPGIIVAITILATMLVTQSSIAHQGGLSEAMLAFVKRDGLMHLINGQRYILHEMLVGKKEVDQEEFVRASKSLAALFSMIPSTFKQNLMVDESRARPEIWQNWDAFVAHAQELQMIAEEMAAIGEIRGAKVALENVRLLDCGGCHDTYRK